MYFTPTLRDYDVGNLVIGTAVNQMGQWIPPGLSYAHNAAFMTNECTKNGIPKEGIKVFGSLLHQHTIGRAINLRHIRNGKEIQPIDINLNYDFNYQQTIIFKEPIILLPGDEFILDCYTNSTKRKYVTIGGESTSQEMCIAFLLYYPAITLRFATVSKSSSALSIWMKDAQTAGYINGTSSDIDTIFAKNELNPDFSSLSYNGLLDGALQFYNRLYSIDYPQYNKHNFYCGGDDGLYNDQTQNVARNESFEKYNLELNNNCQNTINNNNDDNIFAMCVPTGGTPSPTDNAENPNGSAKIIKFILGWMIIVIMLFIN